MKYFYTTINQAILLAEADFGDRDGWFEEAYGEEKLKWMQKYFFPYMKIIKYDKDGFAEGVAGGHVPIYYLPNGSAFASVNGGAVNRDWVFWTGNPKKCPLSEKNFGICVFHFFYSPNSNSYYRSKGVEPWHFDTIEEAKESCISNKYRYGCTHLIQMNNWEIPKDYPYTVKF